MPSADPKVANIKIRSVLATRFDHHPLVVVISERKSRKSDIFGFRAHISRPAATKPAPIMGFREVKGAAKTVPIIVFGWAWASMVPMEARAPLIKKQSIMIYPQEK